MRIIVTMLLFGLLATFATGSESASAEVTLTDVIKKVRENEKIYQNIELVMETKYDIGDRPPWSDDLVFEQETRTRFISQGDWFRLERKGQSLTLKRASPLDHTQSFDGKTTRVLYPNGVGTISPERVEDGNFIRPHSLIARLELPFSVYLSGHKAVRAHANVPWIKNRTMRVKYQGEEEQSGLKCQKIVVEIVHQSGEATSRSEYWLAEERNYLAIKKLLYSNFSSKTLPVSESVVHDLQEISPGVWFPFDVEAIRFNEFTIERDGLQVLQWRERHKVKTAKLDPKFDRKFFTNVDFPEGTEMHELVKGKIVRSWRQGSPKPPAEP